MRYAHQAHGQRAVLVFVIGSALSLLNVGGSVAQDTVVTLKGIDAQQLSGYRAPHLIDKHLLEERARQLSVGLKALTHMSEMISEPHARRAMRAQVDSLSAMVQALEGELQSAASVDYKLATPLPSRGEPRALGETSDSTSQISAQSAQRDRAPSPFNRAPRERQRDVGRREVRRDEIKAMSATQLSRYWGALGAAPFRDEKMKVINQVRDESYLNCEQAELLVEGLTFSKDRRDALVRLYPKLIDPDRVGTLYRLLDHPSHRREVERKIQRINAARRQRQARGTSGGIF